MLGSTVRHSNDVKAIRVGDSSVQRMSMELVFKLQKLTLSACLNREDADGYSAGLMIRSPLE